MDEPQRTKRAKTGGRKKGTPNKVTAEVKRVAGEMVDDPAYRKKLLADLQIREVSPAVEVMLWHYAKGKPTETIKLEIPDVAALGDEDLLARTKALIDRALAPRKG